MSSTYDWQTLSILATLLVLSFVIASVFGLIAYAAAGWYFRRGRR